MPESTYSQFDTTLPYSPQAEQSVLGAVLLQPSALALVADKIKPDYFYLPQHVEIYAVLLSMFTNNLKIDPVTLLEELKKAGSFDDSTGKNYITQLIQTVPSAANIESYANIVREKYHVRSLILAAREIIDKASDPGNDPALLIDSAEQLKQLVMQK